tara:strand:+ start:14 stop:538 length:525 start_codon:yes stop_codon:yes gene_type:complete
MGNSKNHIFIIGMMGSGKSSIAQLLSTKYNIPYIDTDKDLVEIMGAEIQGIFKSLTKKKFYHLESTYFLEHIKGKQHIYATGGGLVLNAANRKALKKFGTTLFLNASINTLFNRLSADSKNIRPLFSNGLSKMQIKKIWEERKKYYQQCSDIIIDTNNKSVSTIVDEIIPLLKS